MRDKQAENEDYFRRLATVLRDSYDAITVHDFQGKILAWNRGAELMYGYAEAEALQMNITDLIPADKWRERDQSAIDLGRGKIIPSLETQRRTKDGRVIDVWLTETALLDDQGEPFAVATTERDITERREHEESLKRVNRELESFAYTIAHDLRTPLTPIIGYAEFIMDHYGDILDSRALDCLEEIMNSGNRMLMIMEDLLTLAKVGHVERLEKSIETRAIVGEVVQDFEAQLVQAGMSIKIHELPTTQLPKIFVVQIFSNLIGNAIRYGGKTGSIIEIGGEREGGLLRFYVRDHGAGIPEQERSRIFDIFYRGANCGEMSGTGLGLATVKKIVELYERGRIWVDETEGGGSTFWVELADTNSPDRK